MCIIQFIMKKRTENYIIILSLSSRADADQESLPDLLYSPVSGILLLAGPEIWTTSESQAFFFYLKRFRSTGTTLEPSGLLYIV